MRRILICIATASLILVGDVRAEEDNWPMWRKSVNGVTYEFSTPESIAQKIPSWTPGKDDAPLSISQAATKALDWIRKQPGKYDEICINSLEAFRFQIWTPQKNGRISLCDKWYYRVDYYLVANGKMTGSTPSSVAVLMDGTVIPPKVVKD